MTNISNSIIDYTKSSNDNEFNVEKEEEQKKASVYNNYTRTPIIKRSKDNLKKKKAQKLARRKNRKH